MRYLEVAIEQPPSRRHPMHQFVVDHEDYDRSRLLYRTPESGKQTALFHVVGPVEPYRDAIRGVDRISTAEITPCVDESFYLYVREEMSGDDESFADAFAHPGLLVVRPVVFHSDGTVRVAALGPDKQIQAAVEAIPPEMDIEVTAVGEYTLGRIDTRTELTARQFEAVAAAVDVGYYNVSREGSIEDVADCLECSTGTAGELLRRAERTVMSNLVGGEQFG